MALRANHIRYIGVGTMLLGGAWTLVRLVKPIFLSLSMSLRALSEARRNPENIQLPSTERDIPFSVVGAATIALAVVAFFIFLHFFNISNQPLSEAMRYGISLFAVIYLLIFGFLLASVCAYMIGLVGATNNPLSGLILGSVLITSLILLAIFGHSLIQNPALGKVAVSVVIIITTVVAIATLTAGETIQDLKAGQMVRATPWKQQVMMMVGVVVASLVIGPALELLFRAYGVGGVYPHPGMDPSQMLAAPQAGLVTAVAQGVFGHSLPWADMGVGMVIAVLAILSDEWLKKKNMRLPVLGIGIGIYLPPEITSAVVMGGILNYFCKRTLTRRGRSLQSFETGTMLACGLVAGAALTGVILAVPFVLKGSSDALRLARRFCPYC